MVFSTFRTFWHFPISHIAKLAGLLGGYNIANADVVTHETDSLRYHASNEGHFYSVSADVFTG